MYIFLFPGPLNGQQGGGVVKVPEEYYLIQHVLVQAVNGLEPFGIRHPELVGRGVATFDWRLNDRQI